MFSELTNSALHDIGGKDDLAAETATAERAALDRIVDLLTINPELAGELEHGQIAPSGMLELGEQVWRFLPKHLDDGIALPAFLAFQLWDGATIEFSSDLIGVGDDAATNPASNQRDDRSAERPALRCIARASLS